MLGGKGGAAESLALAEREDPRPGPGQVLVRVRAASLNYRDLVVARGAYSRGGNRRGLVPLSDGAGEVVAAGEGAGRFAVGDRVAGAFFPGWVSGPVSSAATGSALGGGDVDGVLAEHVVLDEQGTVRLPDGLSYEEAACLPCAAVTAWHALVEKGRLHAGQTVLVLGTGGVSIFALQFAKMHGARVIITSSTDEKLERAKELGADEAVNYEATPEWQERVLELTGGEGVDHVVEVGGSGTLPRSIRATRVGGRISLIGVLTGTGGGVALLPAQLKSQVLQGVYVGSRETFERMNRAVEAVDLRPIIDRVFPFEEAKEAYRFLEAGRHFGKVVVKL